MPLDGQCQLATVHTTHYCHAQPALLIYVSYFSTQFPILEIEEWFLVKKISILAVKGTEIQVQP